MTTHDGAVSSEIHWGAELDDPDFVLPDPPDDYYDDPWADAEQVATKALNSGADTVPLANLPEEFWGSRQIFKDIRQAAHATMNSADAVLGSVIARGSAMIHHEVRFDSGRGPTGCMNLFVSLVAKSGVGKSTAVACADELIQVPSYLARLDGSADPEKFKDGVGLGTGEGLAEAYMGTATRDGSKVDRKGEPVPETYRTQVRNNAFLYLDEGQTLTKMMKERMGTTIGATIRTAWGGGALGQANAQETTTRFVARNSYCMGMVVGYQPSVAQDLLADGGPGTPQRFLWLSAIDPNIPEEALHLPPPFKLPFENPDGTPRRGVIQFPEHLKRQLRREHLAKVRGDAAVDELDSHEPLMLCKLAAELCYWDMRWMVSDDDWELAKLIWRVSCSTRDRLIEFGRQEAARKNEEKLAAKVNEVEAASLATREVDATIDRVARLITRRVRASEEPVMRYKLKKNIGSDNKKFFDAALLHAKQMQWVTADEDDAHLLPGTAAPV
jgi:hypothetical protein